MTSYSANHSKATEPATAELFRLPTGLALFDRELIGIPKGETTLVCGGLGTGKLQFVLQFLHKGLVLGEKVVLVTNHPPAELLAKASSMDLELDSFLEASQLIMIEQKTQNKGVIGDDAALKEMLDALDADVLPWEPARLVFYSAVPFIGLFHPDFRRTALATCIRHYNRANITTVLCTPMPASSEAMSVRKQIEDLAACSLHLDEQVRPDGLSSRRMAVRKLKGTESPYPIFEFQFDGLNQLDLLRRLDVALDAPRVATAPAEAAKTAQSQPIAPPRPANKMAILFAGSEKIEQSLARKTVPVPPPKEEATVQKEGAPAPVAKRERSVLFSRDSGLGDKLNQSRPAKETVEPVAQPEPAPEPQPEPAPEPVAEEKPVPPPAKKGGFSFNLANKPKEQ